MAKGLERFPECFNSYFNIQPSVPSEGEIKIFGCVTLTNGELMCATNLFHGHPWFSNVSIVMDSGNFLMKNINRIVEIVLRKYVLYNIICIVFYFLNNFNNLNDLLY
jgi:hypothetical protein